MNENVYNGTQEEIDTIPIMYKELPLVRDLNLNQPYLTQHKINKRLPNHLCNGLKTEEFGNVIGETYNGIIT